ncbi:SpoIIE family protein phosphatase [[Brevibacterium] frigoritolerans]|uniref:SpoIIE family protein phosphatase n=1 Tax=Peribacillus frigoritolerans TaxID=450367 RepID=A0A941J240_9BACI|nr:SpoIIE family protein phosphatase [Peribacillus frigoritolerans]
MLLGGGRRQDIRLHHDRCIWKRHPHSTYKHVHKDFDARPYQTGKDPIYITEELGKHIRDLFQGVNRKTKTCSYYSLHRIREYKGSTHRICELRTSFGLLYSPCTNQILNLNEGATPSGLIPELPIKKIVFHYEPGSRFIIYTDGLSKTPTPSAIDRSDNIEREFIENVHLDINDLLQELLVSRMRHSVINDDICIIARTLF